MSGAPPRSEALHGTAVSIGGTGVLLLGAPGSGKSDLALRLIDRGALLIADDLVLLGVHGEAIRLSGTGNMTGRMEIRGIGLCGMPHVDNAPFRLAALCDLPPERLPTPEHRRWLGIAVPAVRLAPFEASAPVKLEWALRAVVDGTFTTSKERAFR
ncbi:HPr kinase/phosphorylase [Novosphingopyxis sp.]|uniref:HPr kinase/phosphorylase n=1 Tax=Novosphingopyxis sp. TaxID=2709690 RepID=UPI003B5A33F6